MEEEGGSGVEGEEMEASEEDDGESEEEEEEELVVTMEPDRVVSQAYRRERGGEGYTCSYWCYPVSHMSILVLLLEVEIDKLVE